MGEMLFRIFFPGRAKELKALRDQLLNVVLFPHKKEIADYTRRVRQDYDEARNTWLQKAFQPEH